MELWGNWGKNPARSEKAVRSSRRIEAVVKEVKKRRTFLHKWHPRFKIKMGRAGFEPARGSPRGF